MLNIIYKAEEWDIKYYANIIEGRVQLRKHLEYKSNEMRYNGIYVDSWNVNDFVPFKSKIRTKRTMPILIKSTLNTGVKELKLRMVL